MFHSTMIKTILIKSDGSFSELRVPKGPLMFENINRAINVESTEGVSLTHFDPQFKLAIFFDDLMQKNNRPINQRATRFAQKTHYPDRIDQNIVLSGDCIIMREDDEDIIDFTIKDFWKLYKKSG